MIKEIKAKSIIRKHKKIDSWFLSRYGMNLYRGCTHNCSYCDGRAEGYYVSGEFGSDVEVKVNAIEILKKELSPSRKKTPFIKGFAMIGGGVCDGYQPAEKEFQLTRKVLELMRNYHFPVHLLTKSTLVLRDLDLISEINHQSKAMVSFSFSSCNDNISRIFEPGVPPPSERLEAIRQLKARGISCGMFLMPVIPYITDGEDIIEESIVKAKEAGVDFIIFGGMTLKEGRQTEHFYKILDTYNPELKCEYIKLYPSTKWGNAREDYYMAVSDKFHPLAMKYKMPVRVPLKFFKTFIDQNDLVTVLLEHIDYFLKMKGEKSSFSYAAWAVSQLKVPITGIKTSLTDLKGVGRSTEKIILEILEKDSCQYYEKLANEYNS
jgi:DNA repair photolyase